MLNKIHHNVYLVHAAANNNFLIKNTHTGCSLIIPTYYKTQKEFRRLQHNSRQSVTRVEDPKYEYHYSLLISFGRVRVIIIYIANLESLYTCLLPLQLKKSTQNHLLNVGSCYLGYVCRCTVEPLYITDNLN